MIAIVGNSGSVLKHEHGGLIDKAQLVIRFNDAPVRKFERYVGSGTDIRLIAYHGADYNLQNENIYLYSYNIKAQDEAYDKLIEKNSVNFLGKKAITFCDNLISKPYWRWRFLPGRIIIHKRMSSTGLKAIVWMMAWDEEINLFGFNEDPQFHYYEPNREGYNQDDSHDFKKERKIIKGFEDEGKLKIYS